MKQFRVGDRVRRVRNVYHPLVKGRIYTVSKCSGFDAIELEGLSDMAFDTALFELVPGIKPGMVPGAFLRRTGPSRDDVVSGGVYQIASVGSYSMTLVGCDGTYCFGNFEVVGAPPRPAGGWCVVSGDVTFVTQNPDVRARWVSAGLDVQTIVA